MSRYTKEDVERLVAHGKMLHHYGEDDALASLVRRLASDLPGMVEAVEAVNMEEVAFQLWRRFANHGTIASDSVRRSKWPAIDNADYWRDHARSIIAAARAEGGKENG